MMITLYIAFGLAANILKKRSYVISDATGNKFITTNGTLGLPENNTGQDIKVSVFQVADAGQPFSVTALKAQKFMTVNEQNEIVFNDTQLFQLYNAYSPQCSLQGNREKQVCKTLTNMLDPTYKPEKDTDKDKDKGKEEAEEENDEQTKKKRKKLSSIPKNAALKDIEDNNDLEDLEDKTFKDFFVWSVGISDSNGLQSIVYKELGICLTLEKDKLILAVCEDDNINQKWSFKEFSDQPNKAKEDFERTADFSRLLIEKLKDGVRSHYKPEEAQPVESTTEHYKHTKKHYREPENEAEMDTTKETVHRHKGKRRHDNQLLHPPYQGPLQMPPTAYPPLQTNPGVPFQKGPPVMAPVMPPNTAVPSPIAAPPYFIPWNGLPWSHVPYSSDPRFMAHPTPTSDTDEDDNKKKKTEQPVKNAPKDNDQEQSPSDTATIHQPYQDLLHSQMPVVSPLMPPTTVPSTVIVNNTSPRQPKKAKKKNPLGGLLGGLSSLTPQGRALDAAMEE